MELYDFDKIKNENPELLVVPSAKEIKNLRGIEFIFMYYDEDDNIITEVPAYVAQASIDKGITIRGEFPFENKYGFHENPDDVILTCCSRNNAKMNDPYYVCTLNIFKTMILSGKFDSERVAYSNSQIDLTNSCPFN